MHFMKTNYIGSCDKTCIRQKTMQEKETMLNMTFSPFPHCFQKPSLSEGFKHAILSRNSGIDSLSFLFGPREPDDRKTTNFRNPSAEGKLI